MESEDSSDDDNDESHLYSLLHYSAPEETDSPTQVISEENSSKRDNSTFIYQSKYSKANRWDAVKLISTSDNQPNTSAVQRREIEPVNNYASLLNSYKAARIAQTFGCFHKQKEFDTTYHKNRNNSNLEKKRLVSSPGNSIKDTNKCFTPSDRNSTPSASYHDTISLSYQSPLRFKEDGLKTGDIRTQTQGEAEYTSSRNSQKRNTGTDYQNKNNNTKSKKPNEQNDVNASDDDDLQSSKYNLALRKDVETNDDSVIVIDSDSASDSESVVEVQPPSREPPPLVSLSSDEDIVIHCSGVMNVVKQTSSDPGTSNKEVTNVGSGSSGMLNDSIQVIEERTKKKKKKKKALKKRKRNKDGGPVQVTKKMKRTLRMLCSSTWTKEMSDFYNDSWGGEKFNCHVLQKKMSDNRAMWHVLYSDIVAKPWTLGPDISKKCTNCNVRGHNVYNCPSPAKPIVCLFCGLTGHSKFRCPSSICLTCGASTEMYKERCSNCDRARMREQYCACCNGFGHFTDNCPELWRRYGKATNDKGVFTSRTIYKSQENLFCSNCAMKGHHYDQCQWFQDYSFKPVLKQPSKRPRSPYERNKKAAKRRKFNNGGFHVPLMGTYFQPHYTAF